MSNATLDPEHVMSELRQFVRTKYKVAEDDRDFNDTINLFDYGYVDSFGAVELVSFVENQFGIQIPESDLVICPLDSIQTISDYVVRRHQG